MADKIKIGDVEYLVDCNGLTPIVYSGGLRFIKADGTQRAKDINDGLSEIMSTVTESGVFPFKPMAEFLWAFAKTADKNVSGFNSFVQSLPPEAFDMSITDGWANDVWEMVQEHFFRSTKDMASETAESPSAAAAAGA